MGRKPTGQADAKWLIGLPKDLAEAITARAAMNGLSRNEQVRRMLRFAERQPRVTNTRGNP